MVQNDWSEASSFSRSERRGIIVLILLCFVSGAYSYVVPEYISRREIAKFEHEFQFSRFVEMEEPEESQDSDWNELEIPKEVHVLNDDKSRTNDATTAVSPRRDPPSASKEVVHKEIRINTDAAKEIIQTGLLPPKIAFRLVRFRNDAGGFHSISQVRDIYEMTDSMYSSVSDYLILEEKELVKVSVNSATIDELQKHPYISKGLASQIVNFREKVEPFGSSEDLIRLYFMDEILLEKLKPYISFY